MITAEVKARELVNTYYGHSKSQAEAIEIVERVLLTRLCQDIDSLHNHIFHLKDFDDAIIKSQIQQLKGWQEVAAALQNLK